jgi:peptide/nickel transport system permease protein
MTASAALWRPVAQTLSRELAMTAALLLGVSGVVFLILYLAPGDPFATLFGARTLSGSERAALLAAHGIPETWYGQYLAWIGRVLQGDFGTSIRTGQPVARELLTSGSRTLFLTLGSLIVTLVVALPIAVHAALHPTSLRTRAGTLFVYAVSALPVFWVGYLVIYFFTRKLGLFPILSGVDSAQQLDWLYALLPVVLLGLCNGTLAEVVRSLREELDRVLAEEYVRTARAKGASVWRHAYKEGLVLPITEIVAAKMPFILGGAIIVEQVFNWPGLGRLAWQAAQDRDYPVIMAIALLAAIVVRSASLFHRTIYVAVNPRADR